MLLIVSQSFKSVTQTAGLQLSSVSIRQILLSPAVVHLMNESTLKDGSHAQK